MASNFPTAYVRVASQTYVLQHILLLISLQNTTFLLLLSSNVGKVAEFWTQQTHSFKVVECDGELN